MGPSVVPGMADWIGKCRKAAEAAKSLFEKSSAIGLLRHAILKQSQIKNNLHVKNLKQPKLFWDDRNNNQLTENCTHKGRLPNIG